MSKEHQKVNSSNFLSPSRPLLPNRPSSVTFLIHFQTTFGPLPVHILSTSGQLPVHFRSWSTSISLPAHFQSTSGQLLIKFLSNSGQHPAYWWISNSPIILCTIQKTVLPASTTQIARKLIRFQFHRYITHLHCLIIGWDICIQISYHFCYV